MATDKDTINSYNQYVKKWAGKLRSGKNIAHEYLEKPAMYKKLPNLSGKSVLCVGCGTGEECDYLLKQGAKKDSFPFNWDNYHFKIALLADRFLKDEKNLIY
ncbi:hypothetical protein KKB83_04060 [Patescibacteria group bacterium]|nr:hypothetical protein [Patescibacteria group bacterium]